MAPMISCTPSIEILHPNSLIRDHQTKIMALVLAVMMVLGVATAFAAETTYNITAPADTVTGSEHTYKVYQIFTGDVDANKVLSNVKWGHNSKGRGNDSEGNPIAVGDPVAQTVLDALEAAGKAEGATNATKLAAVSAYVDTTTDAIATLKAGEVYAAKPGYYLVVDDSYTGSEKADAKSVNILQVVGPVTITLKKDVPSSDKKVKDVNDSASDNGTSDWQDSADFDIGDEIEYKITAHLPNNVSEYNTYKLDFVDTMSKGLTYVEGSAKIQVGDGTATSLADPTITNNADTDGKYKDGKTLTWAFANIKATPYSATNSQDVVITYKAKLTDDAVIGIAGNPNKFHIVYSNNPNAGGEGETDETPDDVNIVFTYELVVDKITADGDPLDGAGFTLYKKNSSGEYVAVGTEKTGASMTEFSWLGLDDGDYKLVETKTPAGYNTADPIEFTVTAEHTISSDSPALTGLSVTEGKGLTANLNAGKVDKIKKDTENNPTKEDVVSGEVYGEVVNQSGATLPSTGGIGTTIFYVGGGLLALVAVVLLVTKRRMSAQ